MARRTLVTDSFTYSNGHLGVVAANWANAGTDGLDVSSNQLIPESVASDGADLYDTVVFPNDQWAQITLTVVDFGGGEEAGLGLALRGTVTAVDSGRNMYRIVAKIVSGTGHVYVAKYVANVYTLLADITPVTLADGDALLTEVVGTTLMVYVNGVRVGTNTTDASIASGFPGLASSSANDVSARLDNFIAGDFVASTEVPVVRHAIGLGRW